MGKGVFYMDGRSLQIFQRNIDTINVTLERIKNEDFPTEEITKGHFECIRMAIDHCEELALNKE